jgi:predicted phosphodiesterase
MRIALFSDIHGNDIALEAVLADIEQAGGVNEHWALGDLVALGPAPIRVLEMLTALPAIRILRGNTDRYVFTGVDRPPPSLDQARENESLLVPLVECAGTFAWTQGVLATGGFNEWLAELPLELRTVLPDGTRMLGVHASPASDDGLGLLAGSSPDDLLAAVEGCEADLVLAGHHHLTLDEHVGAYHLVNLGSVSNPYAPDLRASWVLLEADAAGYRIEHRRVDYDHAAVIAEMHALRHPGARYVVRHLAGEVRPPVIKT